MSFGFSVLLNMLNPLHCNLLHYLNASKSLEFHLIAISCCISVLQNSHNALSYSSSNPDEYPFHSTLLIKFISSFPNLLDYPNEFYDKTPPIPQPVISHRLSDLRYVQHFRIRLCYSQRRKCSQRAFVSHVYKFPALVLFGAGTIGFLPCQSRGHRYAFRKRASKTS